MNLLQNLIVYSVVAIAAAAGLILLTFVILSYADALDTIRRLCHG